MLSLRKPRTKEKFFILINYVYRAKTKTKTVIANTMLNGEILNPSPLRSGRG